MTRELKNIAHSVQQRLKNLARQTGQDFNRLLVRYVLERFLYRLGLSRYADKFILKGAMLLALLAKLADIENKPACLFSPASIGFIA